MVDMVIRTVGQPLIPCWFEQIRALSLLPVWLGPYIVRAFRVW